MTHTQKDLVEAQSRVEKGLEFIRRQEAIIQKLSELGQPTNTAEELLANLKHGQQVHEEHFEHVMAELTAELSDLVLRQFHTLNHVALPRVAEQTALSDQLALRKRAYFVQ
jgi:hypothetical protein